MELGLFFIMLLLVINDFVWFVYTKDCDYIYVTLWYNN